MEKIYYVLVHYTKGDIMASIYLENIEDVLLDFIKKDPIGALDYYIEKRVTIK